MNSNFVDRFLKGFATSGLVLLALLGAFVLYRLFHVASFGEATRLVGGWLALSFGGGLAGGVFYGVFHGVVGVWPDGWF